MLEGGSAFSAVHALVTQSHSPFGILASEAVKPVSCKGQVRLAGAWVKLFHTVATLILSSQRLAQDTPQASSFCHFTLRTTCWQITTCGDGRYTTEGGGTSVAHSLPPPLNPSALLVRAVPPASATFPKVPTTCHFWPIVLYSDSRSARAAHPPFPQRGQKQHSSGSLLKNTLTFVAVLRPVAGDLCPTTGHATQVTPPGRV